jgi:hypothetical protein
VTLAKIEAFEVPATVVDHSADALREAGLEGYELFVLWTGVGVDDRFRVQHVYVPRQQTYKGEGGLHVRVEGDELHKLNRWLYEKGQVLAIQVHTHPEEAFHSETDDLYPIVTALGGLSIVVPRFCRDGVLGRETAVYRLHASGWIRVDAGLDLVSVIDDGVR